MLYVLPRREDDQGGMRWAMAKAEGGRRGQGGGVRRAEGKGGGKGEEEGGAGERSGVAYDCARSEDGSWEGLAVKDALMAYAQFGESHAVRRHTSSSASPV